MTAPGKTGVSSEDMPVSEDGEKKDASPSPKPAGLTD